jgi:hypothetical protein
LDTGFRGEPFIRGLKYMDYDITGTLLFKLVLLDFPFQKTANFYYFHVLNTAKYHLEALLKEAYN